MKILVPALALLVVSACGKSEGPVAPVPPVPAPTRPAKLANGEPSSVTVKHVLISFKGSAVREATRAPDEAEKLAYDVLRRAKSGEDFDQLVRTLSEDPGKRDYTLVNEGVEPQPGEIPRSGFVKGFTSVAFRLEVGEVGFAMHDPVITPHGHHIIKRVK